ncbi:hypothetical protein ACEWY4_016886 [Coilia grayii]|uniref:Retrotransposon gag domain-containing protein n=1 Tax=Coilia grayii TaxID=363190 RepID=A0ABD1JLM6_9TELE
MQHQHEGLQEMGEAITQLSNQIGELCVSSATAALPPVASASTMAPPPLFSGVPSTCKGGGPWIGRQQCGRIVTLTARLVSFMTALHQVFNDGMTEQRAASRLMSLSQGPRSVSDYAIEFCTLAAETGWEDDTLMTAFYQGLSESVKDEIVNREWSEELDDIVTLATTLDARMRERRMERRGRPPCLPSRASETPPSVKPCLTEDQPPQEPMQLGRSP